MKYVGIGGSAGAIEALTELVHELPRELDAAIAIVVHLPAHLPSHLTALLARITTLRVHEAIDKAPFAPGSITVATPDYHLLVEASARIALSRDAPVHFSRPAIDPLFQSLAEARGPEAIGILLTGGNADGAAGLTAIQAAGGLVAVQDPATALAPQMPRAGLTACRADLVASPGALGRWLVSVCSRENPS